MNSITSNLVSSATPTTAETLHDPQAQDVHTTTTPAATPGNVEPLPAAQSSLAAFVPEGGLHSVSPKPGVAMGAGFLGFVAMEMRAKQEREANEQPPRAQDGMSLWLDARGKVGNLLNLPH